MRCCPKSEKYRMRPVEKKSVGQAAYGGFFVIGIKWLQVKGWFNMLFQQKLLHQNINGHHHNKPAKTFFKSGRSYVFG